MNKRDKFIFVVNEMGMPEGWKCTWASSTEVEFFSADEEEDFYYESTEEERKNYGAGYFGMYANNAVEALKAHIDSDGEEGTG